jgi:HAD superfamily hydrolase (TIGR01509 family)
VIDPRPDEAPLLNTAHEVRAVIFDLDGVLLESEQVWSAAKRELTRERGGAWMATAEREMLGMSSTEWSRYMRDELSVPMEPQEISAAVAELVAERYRRDLPLIEGADAAVRLLAARFPLGLASSSNRQIIELVLDLTGWNQLFAATTSSEEVAHGKPAPDVYIETVRRIQIAAPSCVAVEDSDAGIRSAIAAGLAVVAIPNRAYPPAPKTLRRADLVLESIAELDAAIGVSSDRSPEGERPRG